MTSTLSRPPSDAPPPGSTPLAWHTMDIPDALAAQNVNSQAGLSSEELAERTRRYGPNAFAAAKQESRLQTFVRQYQDPMQIVLLVAGIITIVALQQWGTGIVLLGLTLFNAMMSMRQEGKAEASVAALQKMLIVKTRVRRGGEVVQLPAEELVPGDIVLVEAGDRVPADGRLLRAATLEIDESALTGESVPVPKQTEAVAGAETPLGDRVDMAYMNTNVTRGTAEILVTATGMSTEVGHISGMLQATQLDKTPLTKQLDALTRQIIIIAMVALAVSIGIGISRGENRELLFLTAVAFAISAIPTGLPAVVTYLLATGTTTLAVAHAIVKRLRSVETLGATSAINSDKTGTLTLNQMTAVEMALVGQRLTVSGEGYSTTGQITRVGGLAEVDLEPYLMPMALASDAVARDGGLVGDPTEGALVVLAAKGGIDAVETRREFPRLAEVPFDAAYKLMATFHNMNDHGQDVVRCFVKGAPDQLLARAANALTAEGKLEPVDVIRDRYQDYNTYLGEKGLRVMALARRDFPTETFDPSAPDLLPLVNDLTLLALVGIVDPPRPEAKTAIEQAHNAGIQVRMITGDHAVTAGAIAGQLGIRGRAITGAEFAAMTDEEAGTQINDIGVIARVTPEHKVRLIDVLKRAGHVTSMTGDGVNDAPALKKADIGVAMGITGTDVSKEAAVMILTDDNFATIVRAVELGRALYDSLVKYIRYQMARLFSFILLFLGASLLYIVNGIPLLPLQTLYINFTVDLFLAIGIGLGAASPNLMQRPPRGANARILPTRSLLGMAWLGLVIAACSLGVMVWGPGASDMTTARTLGFVTFSLAGIFLGLGCNDTRESVFSAETFDNGKLIQMCLFALVATLLVTELGLLQRIFDTVSMSPNQWVTCLVVASIVLWVMEVEKLIRRRRAPEQLVVATEQANGA
ncbi:MAG: cation-transporting P-type ATPase [Chloroflexi bacterium]|nr:cation-transporting P-type ATPase [Chloroflexota bacterium]